MLLTKVFPPSSNTSILRRTRLFDLLNRGLQCKLTLISASAGYGKTSLLGDWINKITSPFFWLSLDENDKDTSEFLSYLITSIQTIYPEFESSILDLIKSSNRPTNQSIIALIINELYKVNKKDDCIIILDDFHLVDSPELAEIISYLLEHLPTSIHVIITTRSDPSFPLSKLRSQNQLVEIRSTDLAFTTNDIYSLFNKKLKIDLSNYDAQLLQSKTEGWIAGIQLAALSLRNKQDVSKFIKEFSGNNRYIMDYLIEEALKSQPEDIQEFLLKTSILEKFTFSLCNKILNRTDSQTILEKFEKNNLFIVPLDADRKWYRYQHLFADLLKQKLYLREEKTVKELHLKSCAWYENQKIYDLAIQHALAIKDYEKSLQLLDIVVEQLWKDGVHSTILNYGTQIPENLFQQHPTFSLFYGWILFNAGKSKEAQTIISQAYEKTVADLSTIDNQELLGKIALAQAHLMSNENQPQKMVAYYTQALEYLSEKDTIWLGWAWKLKGMTEIAQRNIQEGIQALIRTIEYGKKSKNLYLVSSTSLALSYYEAVFGQHNAAYQRCVNLLQYMKEKGYSDLTKSEWMYSGLFSMMAVRECIVTDYDKAIRNIEKGYALSVDEKDITQKIIALLGYSYIEFARGNIEKAETRIMELEELMKKFNISPYINTVYVGWKIYLLIFSDRMEEAHHFIKKCGMSVKGEISFQNEHAYINYARFSITKTKFEQAEIILSKLFSQASTSGRVETIVQVEILYAIMCIYKKEEDQVVSHLVKAIEYAVKEELLHYFVFDIDITRPFLEKAYQTQATSNTEIPKVFITKLQTAIKKRSGKVKQTTHFDLSDRELETLKLMTENLSNKEISEALFVSINTVKTHIKNIYIKLDVNNRIKALEKAKSLHLLS